MKQKNEYLGTILQFLNLISDYLHGKAADLSCFSSDDVSSFEKISKRNSLGAVFYLAVKNSLIDTNIDYLKELEKHYLNVLRKDLLFEIERKELFHFLHYNDINFLPLKGLVLREYYPDIHSREYADNDIQFDSKDKTIRSFFLKRGYHVELFKKSCHDVYFKKPFFNFEMHRALFSNNKKNKAFIEYFGDIFKKAHLKENHEYELKKEDFYIYFTAHSYKHFSNSGCGLRTLVDYYLYLKKNTDLDFKYINKELTKINLLNFSNQIRTLSLKVFEDEQLSEKEEEMLLYIANSGTYGTLENSIAHGINERGKINYFLARVFPPLSYYKSYYPLAYKMRILIPFAWFAGFLKRLRKNPKRVRRELELISKHKSS